MRESASRLLTSCVCECTASDDSGPRSFTIRTARPYDVRARWCDTNKTKHTTLRPASHETRHLITILLNINLLFHSVFSRRPSQTYIFCRCHCRRRFRVLLILHSVVPLYTSSHTYIICVFNFFDFTRFSFSSVECARVKYFASHAECLSLASSSAPHFVRSLLNFFLFYRLFASFALISTSVVLCIQFRRT